MRSSVLLTFSSGLILEANKNVVIFYVSVLTLAVNLVGRNYLLIGRFGMVGITLGNAFSALAFMVLLLAFSVMRTDLPRVGRRVCRFSIANCLPERRIPKQFGTTWSMKLI